MKQSRNPLVDYGTSGVSRQHSQTLPRLPIIPADPAGARFKISGFWHRKLVLDLQTVTSTAWQNGVAPAAMILELLRRADEIADLAEDQGIVLRFPEC